MPGSLRSIVVFLVVFGVLFGLGHLFLQTSIGETLIVEPWIAANIRLAVLFGTIGGLDARVEDQRMLSCPRGAVVVGRGCDGLGALLIVGAAIVGFPASWRSRGLGLLVGALGVFLINGFRLGTLLWIAVHWPDRLEFFHIDVWQPLMMVISFGLFLGWGTLLASNPEDRSVGGPA